MSKNIDSRKQVFTDLELGPKNLSSVPAGSDGQMAVVNDQPGKHLYVRVGGNLVPAIETASSAGIDKTTSAITMIVDPVGGTSPANGIVIHDQTEYNTLGYDLKYMQDAIDILPLGISYPVIVKLEDGEHLTKPNDSGITGYDYNMVFREFLDTGKEIYDTSTWYGSKATIAFEGKNRNVLYTGTGTISSIGHISGISPGGMTVDQYAGKLLIITTGVNAGGIYPICSNTVDTIDFPPWSGLTAGSCTFNIYVPLATVVPSSDGVTADGSLMVSRNSCSVIINLTELNIGSATVGCGPVQTSNILAGIEYNFCRFRFDQPYASTLMALGGSTVLVFNSYIQMAGGTDFSAYGISPPTPTLIFGGCFINGYAYSDLFNSTDNGILGIYNCLIKPDPGWAGTLFLSYGGEFDIEDVIVIGNGTCNGFYIDDAHYGGTSKIKGNSIQISNVATVVNVHKSIGLAINDIISGSGNSVGWSINNGSKVMSGGFPSIGATTGLIIDGDSYTYSVIVTQGSEIRGKYGSIALTTGT